MKKKNKQIKMKILLVAFIVGIIALGLRSKNESLPDYKPTPPVDTFGVWGYYNIQVPNPLDMYAGYDVKGVHITFQSGQIRPTLAGAFDWSDLDAYIQEAADSGYWIGLQCQFGPDATEELWESGLIDSFMTDRPPGQNGPYPDYFDPIYIDYYYETLDSIINHIAAYSTEIKDKILYYQISEGSTGDTGPYKGEPLNIADTIGMERWIIEFRHPAWDTLTAMIAESAHPELRLMINYGNDASDLQYVRENYPLAWGKEGTLSHDVQFEGEETFYSRDGIYTRGEVQGYIINSGEGGSQYKVREAFCLMASALNGGMRFINLTQGWMNTVQLPGESDADQRLFTFYNFYANNADRAGFIVPADRPSFDDTGRFSEAIYGTLAAEGDSTDLLNERLLTLSDSTLYSEEFREFRKVKVTSKYLSWDRVQAIINDFPLLGFVKEEEEDPAGNEKNTYLDDFSVGGVEYYSQGMTLNQIVSGRARIGPDTSMLGRWCAVGDMKIDVNAGLMTGETRDSVRIRVWYYDSIPGTITISCPNGCRDITQGEITVGSSRRWLSEDVTVPRFRNRGNTWDFKIASGTRYVGLIEFENLSK